MASHSELLSTGADPGGLWELNPPPPSLLEFTWQYVEDYSEL